MPAIYQQQTEVEDGRLLYRILQLSVAVYLVYRYIKKYKELLKVKKFKGK